ncbi:hypothetical protein HI909_29680, partial [Klebsiella pneumoniae]|nr:hypothetical protein [Klebsiella pneumoniae]
TRPVAIQRARGVSFAGVAPQGFVMVVGQRRARLPGRVNIFRPLFAVPQQRLLRALIAQQPLLSDAKQRQKNIDATWQALTPPLIHISRPPKQKQ